MAARVRRVKLLARPSLEDHALIEGQAAQVAHVISLGRSLAERLGTSRVWMVNSTAKGGGVAEMLPHTCLLLREVGVDARWLVLEPEDENFFRVTKALHHLLHGRPAALALDQDALAAFSRVSREAARALLQHVEPHDVVIVHDPQPCGIARFVPRDLPVRWAWRCHVGVPFRNQHTEQAWRFLEPWLSSYDKLVFTSDRYIPSPLKARSEVIAPAIDPLSHKNRELSPYKLLGILRSAGILEDHSPAWAKFRAPVERYVGRRDDGKAAFAPAPLAGLWTTPVFLQISRFDALKGFHLTMAAFRTACDQGPERIQRLKVAQARALDELGRAVLLLAGPDPTGVADDPEAESVLEGLCRQRDELPIQLAERVQILRLPMGDPKENALVVNALQRLASVVLQPSIEEGFGLTVTEAMWKGVPVVGSNVGGIAQQLRPGVDGFVVDDPEDIESLAGAMVDALAMVKRAEHMARSARRRVGQHFLILRETLQWLTLMDALVQIGPATERGPPSWDGASVRE